MSKVLTTWLRLPKGFSSHDWESFVYLVVNTITEKKYIGKKFIWHKRRLKVKGKKRRKCVTKESDWAFYKSSSDTLQAEIAKYGPKAFEFHILQLFKTRAEANYAEVKEMFLRDVLYAKLPNGEYEYYNHQIAGRWFRRKSK